MDQYAKGEVRVDRFDIYSDGILPQIPGNAEWEYAATVADDYHTKAWKEIRDADVGEGPEKGTTEDMLGYLRGIELGGRRFSAIVRTHGDEVSLRAHIGPTPRYQDVHQPNNPSWAEESDELVLEGWTDDVPVNDLFS